MDFSHIKFESPKHTRTSCTSFMRLKSPKIFSPKKASFMKKKSYELWKINSFEVKNKRYVTWLFIVLFFINFLNNFSAFLLCKIGDFFRISLYREAQKFWSNQIVCWKCTWHTVLIWNRTKKERGPFLFSVFLTFSIWNDFSLLPCIIFTLIIDHGENIFLHIRNIINYNNKNDNDNNKWAENKCFADGVNLH